MPELREDVLENYRQNGRALVQTIQAAQQIVRDDPDRIPDEAIRERFLEIPARDHSIQLCAVISYYILIKYSYFGELRVSTDRPTPRFIDYYLHGISRGHILETRDPRKPRGFARIAGPGAAAALILHYAEPRLGSRIVRATGADGLRAFRKSSSRVAVVGLLNENGEGHYFNVFIARDGKIRIADVLSPQTKWYLELKYEPSTILFLAGDDTGEPGT